MSLRLVQRLGAFLAGDRLGLGAVSGSIWKDGEEYILVRRADWEAPFDRAHDRLKRENAELRRENAELKRQLAQALAAIEELKAENAALKARVAELEEKLTRKIGQAVGVHLDVRLVEPRTLVRSEGKARRILDQRHKVKTS